jgi:hypothetical protein
MAGFRLDRRHESDRGEIVVCARFPTLGKTAIAGEPVIVCGDGQCSVPGAILSAPILATTKIICDRIRPLAALGHILSG